VTSLILRKEEAAKREIKRNSCGTLGAGQSGLRRKKSSISDYSRLIILVCGGGEKGAEEKRRGPGELYP